MDTGTAYSSCVSVCTAAVWHLPVRARWRRKLGASLDKADWLSRLSVKSSDTTEEGSGAAAANSMLVMSQLWEQNKMLVSTNDS